MIGAEYASALRAQRDTLNGLVAEARRRTPGLDEARLSDFLQGPCNAVVSAVARQAADQVPALIRPVFELAIELAAHGLTGQAGGSGAVRQVWTEVAPACAHLIAASPSKVLALLTNAAVHLDKSAGADLTRWMAGLVRLGGQLATTDQLRALGQLLAWRWGAAHFRVGALRAAHHLPDPLAQAALELDEAIPWPAFRDAILADPWHGFGAIDAVQGISIGAFTGLGGEFSRPPELRATEDAILVRSGARCFQLIADRYGAVLHGATEDDYQAAPSLAALPEGVTLRGQTLTIHGRDIQLDLPERPLMLACSRDTVAACSPYTHAIRLWPRR